MGISDTMRCARCQKDVPFAQVKILPDGKRYACNTCLGIVQREQKEREHLEEAKYDFQCVACRYRFQRASTHLPRMCPQCSSPKLIKFESKRVSVKDLLR